MRISDWSSDVCSSDLAAVSAKALGLLPPPERARMVGYGSFEQTVDTLEIAAKSASPWLLGDRFSAADVYVGSQVDLGLASGSIPEPPAFTAWAARPPARAACQRAPSSDKALKTGRAEGRERE